ncbi:hypothetical protein KQX54_002835 [Cotesia glomerata]|uniref:Uncharacterized protein n=1 Tax=Cotesia glomerata TaxID=32391 RepID=A0AAV7IJ61_COTGL|nr:hypothetical protein KQX54_002835 [Cotesia glomerata]
MMRKGSSSSSKAPLPTYPWTIFPLRNRVLIPLRRMPITLCEGAITWSPKNYFLVSAFGERFVNGPVPFPEEFDLIPNINNLRRPFFRSLLVNCRPGAREFKERKRGGTVEKMCLDSRES